MGYSIDESMVRVDFFKPSGKWYCTEAMKWRGYTGSIQTRFKENLNEAFGDWWKQFDVVCLEPYHEHSFPLQFNAGYRG